MKLPCTHLPENIPIPFLDFGRCYHQRRCQCGRDVSQLRYLPKPCQSGGIYAGPCLFCTIFRKCQSPLGNHRLGESTYQFLTGAGAVFTPRPALSTTARVGPVCTPTQRHWNSGASQKKSDDEDPRQMSHLEASGTNRVNRSSVFS